MNEGSQGLVALTQAPSEPGHGTHLYPIRVIGPVDHQRPETYFDIVARIEVHDLVVSLTRMGGLFVRTPEDLVADLEGQAAAPQDVSRERAQPHLDHLDRVVEAFNLVICQATLEGVISAPASVVEIGYARIGSTFAMVMQAGGGRETYVDRTLGPLLRLQAGESLMWPIANPDLLELVSTPRDAMCVAEVSENLPGLIVGAYSNFSRHQLPESIIDAWFVVEQLLDHSWHEHVKSIESAARRAKLDDPRTYSAAVRAEVLLTAGLLDPDTYQMVEDARKHRNKLAHRAVVSLDAAIESLRAMKAMLERHLGREVADARVSRQVTLVQGTS